MIAAMTMIGTAVCGVAAASLFVLGSLGTLTMDGATLACLFIWIAGSVVLLGSDERRIWSPAVIFFNVFAIFHFGLALVVWSGGQTDDISWFVDSAVPTAFLVGAWGAVGLLSGLLLPGVFRLLRDYAARPSPPLINRPSSVNSDVIHGSLSQAVLLPRVGFLLVVMSILAWFALVLPRVGGRIWGIPYGEYLLATNDSGLGWVYFWMALGFAMSVLPGNRLATWWSVGVFAVWAIIALPIGLRGEVMFPVAAAIMIASHRLRRIGIVTALVGIFFTLFLAALFKEVRKEGWSGAQWNTQTMNPASSVKELGQSLRPTVEVIRWIEGGDQQLNGGSYWVPIERGFLRVFPIQARDVGEEDDRLLNVRVQQRVGPIGFSPVAEAFYNWGTIGVFFVHLLFGWIVAILAADPPSLLRQVIMAVILVPLLIHIRNSFAALPAQVLIGSVVVFGLILAEQWLRSRRGASVIPESGSNSNAQPERSPADQNRPT